VSWAAGAHEKPARSRASSNGPVAATCLTMWHNPGVLHPAAAPYTWDDFVALEEDDPRELIDGELVEVEVPTVKHEEIVIRLGFYLHGWTVQGHGGRVLASGYKIRVSDRRGVMPDLQLYRRGNDALLDQDKGLVRGRPDLVVEIVSLRASATTA
jgi:Uma2 family endonuclease